MVPYKLYFVGAQLLFLSHIAQSFILLTANMADVKKIARKFVSDSLAEKIAEFVAKATEQMVPNVSEENEQNVGEYHNISDDDRLQNIGRQRIEKSSKTTKENYLNGDFKQTSRRTEYEKASTTEHNWNTEKIVNTGQNINWEKDDNDISYEKYAKKADEKPTQDYDQAKPDHEQPTQDYDRSKHDYEPKKHNLDQPKSQYKQWKPDYEQTKHDFDQPKHEYEQSKHDLDPPKHEYDQSKQDYEQPKHDFNLPKHDFDHSIQDYEQSKHDFGQPKNDFDKLKYGNVQSKHNYKQLKNAKKPKIYPHKPNQKINLEELRRPAPDRETNRFSQNNQGSKYTIKNVRENKYPDQNTQKPVRLSTFRPTIDSTILYAGKSLLDETPSPNHKRPVQRGHRLTAFDSTEAKPEEAALNATALPSTLRGFNIQRAMTTQKERTEFDQYDNPKYPKADFIATSGPVALPKVLMQTPWWEKEMPVIKDKDKKLWF